MNGQRVGDEPPPNAVWPPEPQTGFPFIPSSFKTPATPEAASRYFFRASISYGVKFGAAYGGGFGLLCYIIGAIYGAPIGALLGLIAGFFDGLILGALSRYLVLQGKPLPTVCTWVRRVGPLSTLSLGAVLVVFVSWLWFRRLNFGDACCFMPYDIVATFASWHAACVATKKFMQEYE